MRIPIDDRRLRIETWLAGQRRLYGSLVEPGDPFPDRFEQLVRLTEPFAPAGWEPTWIDTSLLAPVGRRERLVPQGLPPEFRAEWSTYFADWRRFYGRNPAFTLAHLLVEAAAMHDGSLWLAGREDAIREWTLGMYETPRPFDDLHGADTDDFRRTLFNAAYRAKGLGGWVYYDDEIDGLVWRNSAF